MGKSFKQNDRQDKNRWAKQEKWNKKGKSKHDKKSQRYSPFSDPPEIHESFAEA